MKTFTKSLLVLLIICPFIISLVSSCAEESDCSISDRPRLNGNIHIGYNQLGRPIRDSLDWLTIKAYDTDSILLNAEENVTTVNLPLRYTADSTVFVFQYNKDDTTQADTITFFYKNTAFFISVDCGYEVKQALTGKEVKYTTHYLDSIHVLNNKDTNVDKRENFQLIFKSDDDTRSDRSIISTK